MKEHLQKVEEMRNSLINMKDFAESITYQDDKKLFEETMLECNAILNSIEDSIEQLSKNCSQYHKAIESLGYFKY